MVMLGLVGPVPAYRDWTSQQSWPGSSALEEQGLQLSSQIRPWDTVGCWDSKSQPPPTPPPPPPPPLQFPPVSQRYSHRCKCQSASAPAPLTLGELLCMGTHPGPHPPPPHTHPDPQPAQPPTSAAPVLWRCTV